MRHQRPLIRSRSIAHRSIAHRAPRSTHARRVVGVSTQARRVLGALLAAGGTVVGCATGLDVTDAELDEICADPQILCEGEATASAGVGGAGALGGSDSLAGGNGGTAAGVSGNGVSGSANGGNGNTAGVFVNTGGTQPTLNGGASGGAPLPLAEGECLDTDDLIIVYTNRGNGATASNQASMTLRVQNPGAAFDLTTLTIRYWFTADGLTDFIGEIDYASQGGGQNLTGSVTVTFGQELGSDYAEIGFTSGGSVGPEGVDQVQIRIHTQNYLELNHANDFSFVAVADSAPNRNLTPYINGVQVGGCVPIP
jgi:hypothetical protein